MYNKKRNTKGRSANAPVKRWQRQVKKNVMEGDQALICKASGKSKSLVSRVLAGKRNNEVILKMELMIQENRKELLTKLKNIA